MECLYRQHVFNINNVINKIYLLIAFIYIKNQAQKHLVSCLLKSVFTIQLAIVFSSQLNYSILELLLQAQFAKGGGLMYIFRSSMTTKDGQKIYAKDYGLRAFKIWIGPGKEPKLKRK